MKILGSPLKISCNRMIYFPRLYLEQFGIDTHRAFVIRESHEDYLIYRPYTERPLKDNEEKLFMRACCSYIPTDFLIRNQLTTGKDCLYLIGIGDGLMISVNEQVL